MTATIAPTALPVVRPLAPGEARDVRRRLRTTLLLGRPLTVADHDLYDDESLHLDWYLTRGQVRVVEHDGRIRGHLLACLDRPALDRWARPRTLRWAGRALKRTATGELTGDARRYVRLRVADELAAWNDRPPTSILGRARVTIDADVDDPTLVDRLYGAMDDLVRDAGLHGWLTDLDVPRRRAAPVRRDVTVVRRVPNRTASWLLGRPTDRVTVAVPLGERRPRPAERPR